MTADFTYPRRLSTADDRQTGEVRGTHFPNTCSSNCLTSMFNHCLASRSHPAVRVERALRTSGSLLSSSSSLSTSTLSVR